MSILDDEIASVYNVKEIILDKINKTLEKINKQFRDILEENPNFTGNLNVSLCLGGLTGINKKEDLKIK